MNLTLHVPENPNIIIFLINITQYVIMIGIRKPMPGASFFLEDAILGERKYCCY